MAPLEPWEKVLVDGENYPQTTHGKMACVECHLGTNSPDKEEAHTGLIPRPSDTPDGVCQDCHEQQVSAHAGSLHTNQQGYWSVLEERGASSDDPAMQEMFGNHCASCHTSCGDCHVSQPASVGGGLLDGHTFTAKPPMTRTCTACHGSRVGSEYLGKHEGIRADAHFRLGRMTCVDCHSGDELHGIPTEAGGALPQHRYDAGVETPSCELCHTDAMADQSLAEHQIHGDRLACQVCHSVSYTSCDSCHVAVSESTGNPYFQTAGTYLGFFIGRNPLPSESRPYEYVTVRHVPVDLESFAFYLENALPNFNARPTWQLTTPHNIQRETPQTESCNSCHGNQELFLTADKVSPSELEANLPVIVEQVPEARP